MLGIHHNNYYPSARMRSEGYIHCIYSSRSVCTCLSVSVCLFVYDYSQTTGYEAAYEGYQQLQCYMGKKINVAILLKQAEKPICIMSTGLPRPSLARSAHRGRIKLLRGYVFKSSAALNSKHTHDHAAS